ncbi:cell division protein PerM [Alloscardovia criceti]|uniref:cell division protein PerM n=1 Tax=Alloscardovia criceti TaxID=356828 RepID=UPI000374A175|nr:DUF6350 family protein [Alloscardovia criceti]
MTQGRIVSSEHSAEHSQNTSPRSARITSSNISERGERSAQAAQKLRSPASRASKSDIDRNPARAVLRGVITATTAFLMYAVALFLFISLFLLVASMEAGTDLSGNTLNITGMLLVLSQGISIQAGVFHLSIVPLGLSFASIALLRSLFIRRRNTLLGYSVSIVVWTLLMAVVAYALRDYLTSAPWQVLLYPCVIAFLAFLWSFTKDSPYYLVISNFLKNHLSARLRKTLLLGMRTARRIFVLYLLASVITFIAWVVMGFTSMNAVFDMTHMGLGSRITTSILSVAWLPNLLIWALAWVLGAQFSIGSLGVFSLWIGQSSSLPPIPVFGLLPEPVATDTMRTWILLAPIVIITLIGLFSLLMKREFGLLKTPLNLDSIIDFIYPIGAFIVSILLSVAVSALVIMLSSGSLGSKNLDYLGLDVSQSLASFGRPIQWGLLAAWLIACAIALIHTAVIVLSNRSTALHDNDALQDNPDEAMDYSDEEARDDFTDETSDVDSTPELLDDADTPSFTKDAEMGDLPDLSQQTTGEPEDIHD